MYRLGILNIGGRRGEINISRPSVLASDGMSHTCTFHSKGRLSPVAAVTKELNPFN